MSDMLLPIINVLARWSPYFYLGSNTFCVLFVSVLFVCRHLIVFVFNSRDVADAEKSAKTQATHLRVHFKHSKYFDTSISTKNKEILT